MKKAIKKVIDIFSTKSNSNLYNNLQLFLRRQLPFQPIEIVKRSAVFVNYYIAV